MKNLRAYWFILIAAMIIWTLAGCTQKADVPAQPGSAGIANPASENCEKQGGTLTITKGPSGGEYGVCVFEDNMQCEEWAMMRGDCPVGGVKITGFVTPASVYCAITGGDYTVTGNSNSDQEEGTCTFKNGKSCDVWKYYQGECTQ